MIGGCQGRAVPAQISSSARRIGAVVGGWENQDPFSLLESFGLINHICLLFSAHSGIRKLFGRFFNGNGGNP